jgi:hypothetical protein
METLGSTLRNRNRARVFTPLILGLGLMALYVVPSTAVAQAPDPGFDHTATRFVLTGSHENVACSGCHALGLFAGTPTACSFCHDGSGMRAESGKPFDHIQTTNRCEDCHTSVTWLQVRFDHVAVSARCSSCHNGVQQQGKPSGHFPTTFDCDSCHNTFGWGSVRFDHSGQGGNCSNCHNGVLATGKPSGHFITPQECDECHRTKSWKPDTFRHTSPDYPGDHAKNLDCRECHPGNSFTVVYTDSPSLAPDCAGCHSSDFKPGPHKKHENPDTDYTFMELRDCSGSCHVYEDATLNVIKKRRNREHKVSDGDFD